jgi:CspA family cold shock protein
MKGNIKWFSHFKGYGFIVGEDGKDVFVHSTSLPIGTEINENDSVEYTIEESERGPKATNVKVSKDN